MDQPKNLRTKIGIIAVSTIFVFLLSLPLLADEGWVTYTSFNEVRRMLNINDTLFITTSGGLLALDPLSNEQGRQFTNLDGLGTTDLTDMIVDESGQKWIAGNGRLIKFSVENPEQFLFMDNDGKLIRLLCLADDGDKMWVGTNIGLVLFSKTVEGGLILDSYQLFGQLSPSPFVYDILLQGNQIWLATSSGIAVADRTNPLALKSPAGWITFSSTTNPELGSAIPKEIVYFESHVYIGTSKGLFQAVFSPSHTTFTKASFLQTSLFTDLISQNDSLFLYSNDGFGVIHDGVYSGLSVNGLPIFPITGDNNGVSRWVGVYSGGIYKNSGEGSDFVRYEHTGMPVNTVNDISISPDGLITAIFLKKPAAELVDGVWVTRQFDVGYTTIKLIADKNGDRWVGTFGAGLQRITSDSVINYDETNSTLRGNNSQNGASYVVVTGLATNKKYLFATSFRALNGYPISIVDLDSVGQPSRWDSLGIANGFIDTFVVSLDCDETQLAVSTDEGGVFYCTFEADAFNSDNITCRHFTHDNSYLRSDVVRVVKFAPDGTLWAGTSLGLSRYDNGIEQFVDVNLPSGVGSTITDIDFDLRGNLWVSTNSGLARFDATSGDFTVITSLNSGLVSNDIFCLTLDQNTGDLYIGTSSGMSILESSVTRYTQSVDSVWAYPNPFVISSQSDRLNFNFARSGSIRIFDVSGGLVNEIPVNSSWNGTNEAGSPVASGVYFFVVTDTDGNVGRGKFLLVRQ